MPEQKIWYEPHPVSPERKAELRAQGYTIIDAQFKPAESDGVVNTNADVGSSAKEAKAGESSGESADANGDGKVTAAELKAALTKAGVKFDARWSKDKLAALWAAFWRWGMTADEWNNLDPADVLSRVVNAEAA